VGQLNEPRWVRTLVLVCVLAMAAFGAAGLLLADLGLFVPLLWIGFGAVAFIGLARLARPLFESEGHASQASTVGAVGACVIAVVSMFWNGVNAAKHVQVNRDGALSLNAGKWIATHGTLSVRAYVTPFGPSSAFRASSTGMIPRAGHLEFDVSHMLSALLAEMQNIGGDRLMFLTVPLLGGLALLVFYLLAARLLRHPFAALAATATLAVLMPQVSFSRDSTTEIPTQVLLFTAVWLLCDRRVLRSLRTGFCAGLLLGLVQAIHGDGMVFLLGLPMLFAVQWLRARRVDRARLRTGIAGCALGAGLGLAPAALDFAMWNRAYLTALQTNLEWAGGALVVITAGSVAFVRRARRPRPAEALRLRRERGSSIAFAAVIIVGFGLWFIRPLVQTVHGGPDPMVALVQRLGKHHVDPTRRYWELSVRWIGWYLGPLTLGIAIVAAAILVACLVRGNLRIAPATTALVLAPPALLYILRPSTAPDQIWAARRFLPAVFPGLILVTFGLLVAVARDRERPLLAERRFAVVALAVVVVAVPLYTIHNVAQMTEQRGLFPVITDACRIIGPHSAVVFLEEAHAPKSVAYLADPQTLRSFCDVPVVVKVGAPNPAVLRALATNWKLAGRRLFVVSAFPDAIHREFPHATVQPTIAAEEPHLLEQVLSRAPNRYTSDSFHITAASQLMIAAVPRATAR
jgi:hypothetical protein